MDAKREVLKFDTESRSCTSRVSHTQKELAKAQTQLKKEDGDYKKLKQNEVTLKKELESLKQKLPKNFSQEQYDNLVIQKKEIVAKIKENEARIHNMRMRLQSADFQYKSPSNNFDRSKV
jgi:chromosome segregation ATPase